MAIKKMKKMREVLVEERNSHEGGKQLSRRREDNYHTRIIMILRELLIVPVRLGDSTSKNFHKKKQCHAT